MRFLHRGYVRLAIVGWGELSYMPIIKAKRLTYTQIKKDD